MSKLTPEVLWAQRSSATEPEKNHVFLTLTVPNVPKDSAKLDIQPNKLIFSGHSTTREVDYAVELEFYAEVDPQESKIHHTDRGIDLVLRKKDLKEEYWPRLLKESKKVHFLKTDFDKWVDEDEQDAIQDEDDYMKNMNPMGGDGGFGGIDFSKLGGAGGDFGGSGAGMEDLEGEDEGEDSDEDMPELEATADSKAEPEASKKIEEL